MPTVPSACQGLADDVASLEQQYGQRSAQVSGLTGAAAWTALGELGGLLSQLLASRAELDQCVATHSAALTGTVNVIDATGVAAAPAPQTATLWDLTEAGASARELVPVQNGAFGFQGPLPARLAVTIQTQSDGAAGTSSVDFRSGELPSPAAGQAPRIEMVVLPTLTLPTAVLNRWASSWQPVTQAVGASGPGPGSFSLAATVSTIAVTLGSGTVTVSGTGTVNASAVVGSAGGALPFSVVVTVSLAASALPQASDVVQVALAGPNPVSVSLLQQAGPLAGIVNLLSDRLSPFAGAFLQQAVSDWAHAALPDGIAARLALAGLPADAGISLRGLTVDVDGIRFQPVLGALGTTLSTFTPQPLPLPS